MIINEILSPLIRASCTHAGATKVTVFGKTAKNQDVICSQTKAIRPLFRAGKRHRRHRLRRFDPFRHAGVQLPRRQPHSKNTPGAPSATLSGPESRPRRLLCPPPIDATHWPTMRIRPVPPICHRNCIAFAPFIYPHYLLRPLSRLSAPLSLPPGCTDHAEPVGTDYLRRLSAPCYLRRTVCRGALSIVSGLSSSSSSSRISATRSSVISPSV